MTQGTLTERITRSLAYMLRHRPEEFDLDLDGRGAGDLGEVVTALSDRLGEDIEEPDVHEALDAGGRSRYAIEDGRIRALYGHSFSVDPGENTDPPEFLYVGVGSRDARRAEDDVLL
jgi:putative RNA 2'-phosphotransferase